MFGRVDLEKVTRMVFGLVDLEKMAFEMVGLDEWLTGDLLPLEETCSVLFY